MKPVALRIMVMLQFVFAVDSYAQYNFDTYFSGAKKDIAANNYTEAIEKLNICLSVKPNNGEVLFFRGVAKYSLYDDIGAEQDLTAVLSSGSMVYYDAFLYRSLVRYRLGNYQGAIDDITKVIEKQPTNAKLYVERGFGFLANNDFNAALADCKKALSMNWFSEEVYVCKAAAEDALAEYDNALSDYNQVLKINPVNKDAYVRRGMTKYKMENYNEAIEDYNHAIKIDSACTFAYYNRAAAEIKLNDTKKAMSDYDTVLYFEPRNAYAYFDRAVLFSNLQKYRAAIADFDKVLLLNPDNIQALFNRAKLKQNIKNFKAAIIDYDKIIKLYPYFTEAYYNRSQCKYNLKDFAGSKKDLETGKMMSEVLHAKSSTQLSRDSVILANLTHLSADFNAAASPANDTVSIGFLPVFYLSEKDSSSPGNFYYSLLLDKINKKKKAVFCFTNVQPRQSAASGNNLNYMNADSITVTKNNADEILSIAILKTNMLLLNDAGEYYDKIIEKDGGNAIAYFARAVNTCRQVETMNDANEPYMLSNASHTIVKNKRNEKCKSALADFTKAIQLQPSFTFAYYNRAYMKTLLQDFDGAMKDYDTALRLNADFAEALYNEGFLLYYLNNRQQACANFSKAGELGITESYFIMKRYCNK
jgi:tetratricopeptide (TPR) repeat protein